MFRLLQEGGGYPVQAKYLPLLKLLFEKNSWITASAIADNLDISVRTVKTYISELNGSYPDIIRSSSHGYHINSEIGAKALKETKSSIPQTARERASYIINKVIKSQMPVSVYDLCEELFISTSTLRAVLPRIKKKLEPFDLTLLVSSDELSIEGLEKNKRKLLSSLLYHESNENFVNLETIQNAFLDIDIHYIRNVVLEVLNEYRYFINDYSLINLVLHIAIAIDRIQNHYIENNNGSTAPQPKLNSHEYELSRKVIKKLEGYFHIVFSEDEISEMTLLLISRATSLNYQTLTVNNLDKYIGKDCLDLVHKLVNDISSYYYINLYEPEFFIRFALHIKNLLIRAQTEHFSKNPLTDHIKVSCPLIYDNAVWISSIIKEHTGIFINDDEIAYIALHLGSALEAQKELASKLSVVVYCPTYYNMNERIYDTLANRFSSELMIANVVTEETYLNNIGNSDLVISTVPINMMSSIPRIQVQPFLSEADITSIHQKIVEIKADKKRKTFITYLKQIFPSRLFECGHHSGSREELIHYLCQKLLKYGYTEEHFEQEVLAREEMSSTGFQNFAIPHALKMNAKKTGMFIYLSEIPVDWNGTPVFLVILLCFNKEDRYIFNEIFEPLTMILTDNSNMKKALTITDHETFIQFLSNCL